MLVYLSSCREDLKGGMCPFLLSIRVGVEGLAAQEQQAQSSCSIAKGQPK